MQLLEFEKKSAERALGVVVAADSEDALEAELPALMSAVRDWARARGEDARFVMITVVGPDSLRYFARRIIERAIADDSELASLAVEVHFRDPSEPIVPAREKNEIPPHMLGLLSTKLLVVGIAALVVGPAIAVVDGGRRLAAGGAILALGVISLVLRRALSPNHREG